MRNRIYTTLLLMLISVVAFGQKKMKSPAASSEGSIDGVKVEVKYHQPSVQGRQVMGKLVPYGQVWRTGANNATTISFDQDVKVEGKALPKGTYALFTIPGEGEWEIIFNKNANQWGAFNYDKAEDVLRVKVKSKATSSMVEAFTITVGSNDVSMAWENTEVKFKVSK
ncbi:DUF2911 domain-containing protein [Fulvivirga ligni]|uniref:DUF2911 domain-containing protein n=1 Tax=Fulvivirga ligni TaxID=2904246 RepID=UPI001F3960E9|nr:DUF2911 domain-containing protein [Fulvivirga ligni]UII23333.1 DUF2911 domain-containing protein [Fulvivirga ligni]